MVTYDFYQNTYLGSALSEVAFKQAAARAEQWLTKLERSCHITSHGPDSYSLAVCAVAEVMDTLRKSRTVKSQSIGGVSITYADDSCQRLERQLIKTAEIYLDICRGVD